MPFDWLHPKVGRPRSSAAAREEVYRQELKERAALLYRLGFSGAQAKERLAARVAWDYEVGSAKAPVNAAEVATLVDQVYARHGVGAGPLTV